MNAPYIYVYFVYAIIKNNILSKYIRGLLTY